MSIEQERDKLQEQPTEEEEDPNNIFCPRAKHHGIRYLELHRL